MLSILVLWLKLEVRVLLRATPTTFLKRPYPKDPLFILMPSFTEGAITIYFNVLGLTLMVLAEFQLTISLLQSRSFTTEPSLLVVASYWAFL
jgi:hypothetical protein